jgi:hypothetical protein
VIELWMCVKMVPIVHDDRINVVCKGGKRKWIISRFLSE